MRIGVMSDIHGNAIALDAVLADIQTHPVDRWVCLGDVVQGGSQPAQVIERMRTLDCPIVVGNTDAFIVDGHSGEGDRSSELLEVRDWTLSQIGDDGVAFLQTFQPTVELDSMLCFHGTPRSFDEVLLPETSDALLRDALGDAPLQCGGHTHLQWTTTVDEKTFFNPGSVGLSYNRHQRPETFRFASWAEYAVVENGSVEFCRVPFDVEAVKDVTLRSGHPHAERLVSRY